jgi:hypothetical protein
MTLTRSLYLYEPSSPLNLDFDVNLEQEDECNTLEIIKNIDSSINLSPDLQTEHISSIETRKRHYSSSEALDHDIDPNISVNQKEPPRDNSDMIVANEVAIHVQSNPDKCQYKRVCTDVDNVKLQENRRLSTTLTSTTQSSSSLSADSTNIAEIDDHATSTIEFNMIFNEYDYLHEANDVFGLGLFKEECITDEDLVTMDSICYCLVLLI